MFIEFPEGIVVNIHNIMGFKIVERVSGYQLIAIGIRGGLEYILYRSSDSDKMIEVWNKLKNKAKFEPLLDDSKIIARPEA